MTTYNPSTDADKVITAGLLFSILEEFAEQMTRPSQEIINALGYTPSDAADEGVANGIATLDEDGKLPDSQLSTNAGTIYVGASSATPNTSAKIWIQA